MFAILCFLDRVSWHEKSPMQTRKNQKGDESEIAKSLQEKREINLKKKKSTGLR